MYSLEWENAAVVQAAALPGEALAPFMELLVLLGIEPWSGRPGKRENPDSNILTHHFGKHAEGFAEYLILEDQWRVVMLKVIWAG